MKIKEEAARATALARVPNATVQSKELEHEGGRWIYSYDLKVAGKSGIEEVNVDANTGKIVAVEHEGPKAEAKEEAADANAAARGETREKAGAAKAAGAEAKQKAAAARPNNAQR